LSFYTCLPSAPILISFTMARVTFDEVADLRIELSRLKAASTKPAGRWISGYQAGWATGYHVGWDAAYDNAWPGSA